MALFRIKICGVTRPSDACAIAAAGADAIGLNFYAGSSRHLSRDQAHAITASLPAVVQKVGVFVNATAAEIRELAAAAPLDWIQLHGDEPPGLVAELAPLGVIRAWRIGPGAWERLATYLAECRRQGALPRAILLDAAQGAAYGGTGKTLDWSEVARHRAILAGLPLILAGGLRPENVAEAIRVARPDGVDTASGVEIRPGEKDPARVQAFVAAAKASF